MKHGKKLIVALCATAAVFTGCSKSEKITLKVGDNWGASHPVAAALDNVFKPQIEKETKGTVTVEIYHSGTLGNEADLWNGVRNGTIEVAIVGTPMNQEYATMMISDWPFLYRDLGHAKNVWTSAVADEINAEFHAKFPTTYMLAWGPNSARTFTSNKKLTSVDDFKGQKFRMPGNPIHVGIASNLGANAQVIPLGELFSALETGVVDGQDNGMVTVISEAFYEVQKYIYETNHIIATLELIVSAPFLDGLPAETQKIVAAAAKATMAQAWDDYIKSVDNDRAFLTGKGLTVTACSPDDQARIVELIKPLTDGLYAQYDWAKPLTDRIKAIQ
ncbi:MAG: TRAP transporter substrate-binding protein [Spirochaetaceae bacterium]|jgi:tripartite ATP-independent transporter DctP family solute receptor|nr:TRAP transporter substrate-binding protein [Spirochaetaceae bacterium]